MRVRSRSGLCQAIPHNSTGAASAGRGAPGDDLEDDLAAAEEHLVDVGCGLARLGRLGPRRTDVGDSAVEPKIQAEGGPEEGHRLITVIAHEDEMVDAGDVGVRRPERLRRPARGADTQRHRRCGPHVVAGEPGRCGLGRPSDRQPAPTQQASGPVDVVDLEEHTMGRARTRHDVRVGTLEASRIGRQQGRVGGAEWGHWSTQFHPDPGDSQRIHRFFFPFRRTRPDRAVADEPGSSNPGRGAELVICHAPQAHR